MKELGITKGEWNVGNEYYRHKVMVNNASIHIYHTAVTFDGVMITYDNAKANAELIADAGNTAQKCGLLPSELLQPRDELKEALINVMVVVRDCYPLLFDNEKPAVKQAEAAIKNTER